MYTEEKSSAELNEQIEARYLSCTKVISLIKVRFINKYLPLISKALNYLETDEFKERFEKLLVEIPLKKNLLFCPDISATAIILKKARFDLNDLNKSIDNYLETYQKEQTSVALEDLERLCDKCFNLETVFTNSNLYIDSLTVLTEMEEADALKEAYSLQEISTSKEVEALKEAYTLKQAQIDALKKAYEDKENLVSAAIEAFHSSLYPNAK